MRAGSVISVTGDLDQTANASIDIEIGGTAITEFGRLTVNGVATLTGSTLNLNLVDGFTPSAGQNFQILTYGSHIDEFAAVNGTDLGGSLAFALSYNPGDLTLTVEDLGLAFWSFDEQQNPTIDLAGSRQGDVIGVVFTKDAIAPVTNSIAALTFDGRDDAVSVPDENSLDLTDDMTLVAWVNILVAQSTTSFSSQVVGKPSSGNDRAARSMKILYI